MALISASGATAVLSVMLLATALPAQTTDAASQETGTSKVRIVRLSEVKGVVHVDRNTGRGFEPAMTNLPIVEKSRLRTDDGVAEVEFEDNSTLRVAPESLVEFPQLERTASGSTASSVHVLKGTAYVSLVNTKGNEFTLLFGQQKLALPPASHIRLDLKEEGAQLAVLEGNLRVDSPQGAIEVQKKKTITFKDGDQNPPTVAKSVTEETFDSWDHTATGYHARTASLMGSTGSPYAYGINDMNYYGAFSNVGGCGSMWRPYFASAAWDPYSNGAWAWYSGGAGYSWVSPYPWGWTPYHSGTWNYCPNAGWGWMPGNEWYGLNNIAYMPATSGAGGGVGGVVTRPVRPIHPPVPGQPTISAVNLKPLVRSELAASNSFVFRKDSAGFGVPRDGFGKLDKVSREAVSRGASNTPVFMNVPAGAIQNGHISNSGVSAVSVHRGYAPAQGGPVSNAVPAGRGSYAGGGGANSSMASPSSSRPSAPASSAGSAKSH